MPGHEAGIARLLDEEAGVPAQDVGTEHVLDGIEYLWMPDHLVDPGKQHMAAMAHLALDRPAARSLVIFQLAAEARHLISAQHIDREVITVAAIAIDIRFAQHLGHIGLPLPS